MLKAILIFTNFNRTTTTKIMKKILFLSGFLFLIFSCNNEVAVENPIEKFQKDLIEQGVTGSNVAQVYKDGEIIYNNISNSGALGDKDIDANTIFFTCVPFFP